MSYVAIISSVITCILFVFYIIGHIWTYFKSTKFLTVSVTADFKHSIDEVDYWDLIADDDAHEMVLLNLSENVKKISIYRAYYDERSNKLLKKELIDSINNIQAGKTISIKCIIPEGIPVNIVEVIRNDEVVEEFDIGADGTNFGSGADIGGYIIKRNNIKSILYYLFK